MKGHKVVIANDAKAQLRQAYNYIRNDSARNAEKGKAKILVSIKELAINPEKHPRAGIKWIMTDHFALMNCSDTALATTFPMCKLP